MKEEKSCGAVIFRKDPLLFLLVQHRKGRHWDFPKGHVEEGETEEETAIREVLEETGLKVNIINSFRELVLYNPAKNVSKTVVFFLTEAASEKVVIQEKEIKDYEWLEFENAHEKITFESSKRLLKAAYDFLKAKE